LSIFGILNLTAITLIAVYYTCEAKILQLPAFKHYCINKT